MFKSLFRHHNQSFSGADNDAGRDFAVRAQIAADDHRTTINHRPGQRIERARHQTAPAGDAVFQTVMDDAGFGIFLDIAHDAGVHTLGIVAVPADELDFVPLEQIAPDGNS